MTWTLLAAAFTALAVGAVCTTWRREGQARLRRVTRPAHRPAPAGRPAGTQQRKRRDGYLHGRTGADQPSAAFWACGVAGLACALLLGGPLGIVAGAVLAVGGPVALRRLEPKAVRIQREQLRRDLPLALDLLSACLLGGAALPVAARAVSGGVPGPCGERLAAVAAALAVGSPPAEAWTALAGGDPQDPLGPASRALARAAEGGAPVASAVNRMAAQAREDARSRGEQAARRAGVYAVAPLGLCFLPAFVLVGVVPVIAGLVGPLLAGFG